MESTLHTSVLVNIVLQAINCVASVIIQVVRLWPVSGLSKQHSFTIYSHNLQWLILFDPGQHLVINSHSSASRDSARSSAARRDKYGFV